MTTSSSYSVLTSSSTDSNVSATPKPSRRRSRPSASASGHGDDDLRPRLARAEVTDRCGAFAQRVRALDARRELARLEEALQESEISLVGAGDEELDPLT